MRNKLFTGALALALTCTTVFSGVAPATVKASSVSTVQTQTAENRDDYVYCYAGLTWAEYWNDEQVYNAGSTETSEDVDSKKESDKGAFDVVTRATANHGLHRGNFQCTAIVYDTEGNTYTLDHWKNQSNVVLTNGSTIGLSKGTITLSNGEIKKVDHYQVTGIKYVPVKVKSSDYTTFKSLYPVVENGGTLAGGYGEGNLQSYSKTANVTENTNGLKTAINNNGTFKFTERKTGTDSGILNEDLKKVDSSKLIPDLKTSAKIGTYGEFIRLDFTGEAYADLGASMQTVKWTYYGSKENYEKKQPLMTYGTKFAADNWMHKTMGIQLGLTDSLRCQLPTGSNGTGYWTVTFYALGYEDYTYQFEVTGENLPLDDPATIDTSKLQALVDEVNALKASDYTAESWNASGIELELQEAVDLLAAEQKNQASIDEQCTHLTEAMKSLVKITTPSNTTTTKNKTTTASKPNTTPALKKANVKLSKPVLKVGKTTKNKVKVTWKKVKKATGYEIQYTTKGFGNKKATKTIKVSKAKITSAQLKNLKKKTRYKVRIRAVYKKAGYKTVTSKWSATKIVKTK